MRVVALVLVFFVVGCAKKRAVIPTDELERQRAAYYEAIGRDSAANAETFVKRIKLIVDESPDAPVTLDILALSGGGPNGAFGTGLMRGWGTVKSGEFQRPEFDIVTGISTGCLIAPFAIAGTDETYAAIDELYRHPPHDWIETKYISAILGGERSMLDATELWDDVREEIDAELIATVAQQRARHRMMLIGTVNADLGVRRIWNAGLLAQEATEKNDLTRIHNVLIASSAYPGAFPPVEIDGHLHIDGGMGSIFVAGIDAEWIAYAGAKWRRRYGKTRPLPTIRLWIVVNSRLQTPPTTVQPEWSTLLARGLDISGRISSQSLLNEMIAGAALIKARHGWNIEVRYMAIPDAVKLPASQRVFDDVYMRKLSDIGREMGANPENWRSQLLKRNYPDDVELQPESE